MSETTYTVLRRLELEQGASPSAPAGDRFELVRSVTASSAGAARRTVAAELLEGKVGRVELVAVPASSWRVEPLAHELRIAGAGGKGSSS